MLQTCATCLPLALCFLWCSLLVLFFVLPFTCNYYCYVFGVHALLQRQPRKPIPFSFFFIESTSIFYGRGRNAKFLSPMKIRMHAAKNCHFAQTSNIYLNSAFPIWLLMEF